MFGELGRRDPSAQDVVAGLAFVAHLMHCWPLPTNPDVAYRRWTPAGTNAVGPPSTAPISPPCPIPDPAVVTAADAIRSATIDTAPVDTATVDTATIGSATVDTATIDTAAIGSATVGTAAIGTAAIGTATIGTAAITSTAITGKLDIGGGGIGTK